MFVVMHVASDIDYTESNPILVTSNMQKAEDKVEEMRVRLDRSNVIRSEITNELDMYELINPRPTGLTSDFQKRFGEWIRSHNIKNKELESMYSEQELDDYNIMNYSHNIWIIVDVPYAD